VLDVTGHEMNGPLPCRQVNTLLPIAAGTAGRLDAAKLGKISEMRGLSAIDAPFNAWDCSLKTREIFAPGWNLSAANQLGWSGANAGSDYQQACQCVCKLKEAALAALNLSSSLTI